MNKKDKLIRFFSIEIEECGDEYSCKIEVDKSSFDNLKKNVGKLASSAFAILLSSDGSEKSKNVVGSFTISKNRKSLHENEIIDRKLFVSNSIVEALSKAKQKQTGRKYRKKISIKKPEQTNEDLENGQIY